MLSRHSCSWSEGRLSLSSLRYQTPLDKFPLLFTLASQVAQVVKNPSANAGDVRDPSSMPGLGRSPGEGNDNPLQYSFLGNPTDSSLVGYSPQCRKRQHDLAFKQQQQQISGKREWKKSLKSRNEDSIGRVNLLSLELCI